MGSDNGLVCNSGNTVGDSIRRAKIGRPCVDHTKFPCTRCGEKRDRNTSRCLKCSNEIRKELRSKNVEKSRAYNRAWYSKNIEKARINAKRNYQKHKERAIAYATKWNKEHPRERSRIMTFQNAKRRSRIKAAVGRGFNKWHWDELIKRTNGVCCYCRKNKANSIDHFYPISKNGWHDFANIVPSCNRCNSLKRDTDPLRWIIENMGNQTWNFIQKIKFA